MLTNPLVSVIVPNYNHARYLRQRLDSVFNQTYKNFEVILLDDLSQDNSVEILNSYKDERITHRIYNQQNSGSTFRQWKKGLELAKGDLIWIAESDDWADVAFLEKMVAGFTENDDVAVAYCDIYNVDEKGNEIEGLLNYNQNFFSETNRFINGKFYIENLMLVGNSIVNASGVIFERNIGLKHIQKILDYKLTGDWLFWILLLSEDKACVYFRGVEKLNYFRHSLQTTRIYNTIEKRENGCIEAINVVYNTLQLISLSKKKCDTLKRYMLLRWFNEHLLKDGFSKSFSRILYTPMFLDLKKSLLYKSFFIYKFKNIIKKII